MVKRGPLSMVVLVTLCVGVVVADEVTPPAGTTIKFDKNSPVSGAMHIAGSGEYAVPAGWARDSVVLRIYKVKADGTKGDFLKEATCKAESNVWTGAVPGLSPNTEYYVEAKMKVTKGRVRPDYAYVTTEAKKKTLDNPPPE